MAKGKTSKAVTPKSKANGATVGTAKGKIGLPPKTMGKGKK